jgi:hypothetical protein
MDKQTEEFYSGVLSELLKTKLPFMIAGTFAVREYTGIERDTKDMDIFCKAGDFNKILSHFTQAGYETEIEDERWIAKITKGDKYFDIIFGSTNAITPVQDNWFEKAPKRLILGHKVLLTPVEILIWSKLFVADRYKYDGSDIAHLILRTKNLDWKRVMSCMDQYWEVLLINVINFRFIYPSEREKIPRWVLDELLLRLEHQINSPTPQTRVCRGRLFSRSDYLIDIAKWGFADLIGEHNENV